MESFDETCDGAQNDCQPFSQARASLSTPAAFSRASSRIFPIAASHAAVSRQRFSPRARQPLNAGVVSTKRISHFFVNAPSSMGRISLCLLPLGPYSSARLFPLGSIFLPVSATQTSPSSSSSVSSHFAESFHLGWCCSQ